MHRTGRSTGAWCWTGGDGDRGGRRGETRVKGAIIQQAEWVLCACGCSGTEGRGAAPSHNVYYHTEQRREEEEVQW